MTEIRVDLRGFDAGVSWLGRLSPTIRAGLSQAMADETESVKSAALDRMASLFQHGGGAMRDSISTTVEDSGGTITGTVTASGLPYLRIQEFGGRTRPHEIFARNGKVLAFLWNRTPVAIKQRKSGVAYAASGTGPMQFFKHVSHPGSNIPQRSFLRAALWDRRAGVQVSFLRAIGMALRQPWSVAGDVARGVAGMARR